MNSIYGYNWCMNKDRHEYKLCSLKSILWTLNLSESKLNVATKSTMSKVKNLDTVSAVTRSFYLSKETTSYRGGTGPGCCYPVDLQI